MTTSLRLFLAVAGASTLSVAALAYAPPDPSLEIVIGNGPYAGTYKLSTSAVDANALQTGKNHRRGLQDFDASDLKKVGEAGINITNPDETGPKRGDVLVAFGAPG